MIRGGIARGRGGIARGTPSPGSHLSVSREILRWDGVGSTVLRECKTNKIYPILRNDAGKLILMKRVANRRNTAYNPAWWNTGQGANRTKESIVRPGQNYILWICHPDDWTIVHTFGSVLDKNWKMDARTDTKMFQFLKQK